MLIDEDTKTKDEAVGTENVDNDQAKGDELTATVIQSEPEALKISEAAKISAPTFTKAQLAEAINKAKDDAVKLVATELGFNSLDELKQSLEKYKSSETKTAEQEKAAQEKLLEVQSEYEKQQALLSQRDEQIRILRENEFITSLAAPANLNFINPSDAIQMVDRSEFDTENGPEAYQKSVEKALKNLAKSKPYLVNKATPVIVDNGNSGKSIKKEKKNSLGIENLVPAWALASNNNHK